MALVALSAGCSAGLARSQSGAWLAHASLLRHGDYLHSAEGLAMCVRDRPVSGGGVAIGTIAGAPFGPAAAAGGAAVGAIADGVRASMEDAPDEPLIHACMAHVVAQEAGEAPEDALRDAIARIRRYELRQDAVEAAWP